MPDPNQRPPASSFIPTGQFTPEGRPLLVDPRGGVASEISITVSHPSINGGKPTNIPSIFAGKPLEGTFEQIERQAVEMIIKSGGKDPDTGRVLPGFGTMDEAVEAARKRSMGLGPAQTPLDEIFR